MTPHFSHAWCLSKPRRSRSPARRETRAHAFAHDTIVLALPRGGVPAGADIATALQLPLDVMVVRRLQLPSHPELTMGAVAAGGVRVINRDIVEALRLPSGMVAAAEERESREVERRERVYRDGASALEIEDRVVLLVDDGVATGSTMVAAATAVERAGARQVVLATPVIAYGTYERMRATGRDVVHVHAPVEFFDVAHWYIDLDPPTDQEVREILARFHARHPRRSPGAAIAAAP